MARYTGAVCRLCRREGQKLIPERGDAATPIVWTIPQEATLPASTARAVRRASEYGLQLREKQNGKTLTTAFLEGQFSKIFRDGGYVNRAWPVKTC